MRDCMDRRVNPPERVTSPTWGPPPPCKQALNEVRHQISRSDWFSCKLFVNLPYTSVENFFAIFCAIPLKSRLLYNVAAFALARLIGCNHYYYTSVTE